MASNKFTYEGTVHFVGDTQTWSSGFSKRTLVLSNKASGSEYVNYAAFDFVKDKTRLLDGIREGMAVAVDFYLDANENRNKPGQWFVNTRAVELRNLARPQAKSGAKPVPAPAEKDKDDEYGTDEMPF